jgi:hypothetical protein
MPKALDPMWVYGTPVQLPNRQILTCNLCGKKIYSGISRLKYHLAKIPGFDVEPCKKSSAELVHIANQSLIDMANKRDATEARKTEIARTIVNRGSGTSASEGGRAVPQSHSSATGPSTSAAPSSTSSYFVMRSRPGGQPSIRSLIKTKETEEADKLVAKCFLWSDIPFNIANNPFYHPMFEAAAIVGPGYRGPSYHDLRGRLLQGEKADCTERLAQLRETWKTTGCTVMSDGWTDGKGRSILNFLVSCPKGTMFIKSVDASAYTKDAQLLCELLDGFIREIGPQYVVQVITDNAANYVAAGRMLMERYPSLFWSPCAAHCIDLMLEDIGKLPWIKEIIETARSVTKYIYNHTFVLSLMRQFTGNKELVRPAITRFATTFISLQSLLQSMLDLQRMFLSDEWAACVYSTKHDGQAIAQLVGHDLIFWSGVGEVCTLSEPLVKVLRLVDGEKPAMGYLYEAMDRAKETIYRYYENKGEEGLTKRAQIWGVIDERWNNTLHRPIHAAGLYLNPAFAYACGFNFDGEVIDGFLQCVQRMVLTPAERSEISRQNEIYRMASGMLGYDMAVQDRTTRMPGKLQFQILFIPFYILYMTFIA